MLLIMCANGHALIYMQRRPAERTGQSCPLGFSPISAEACGVWLASSKLRLKSAASDARGARRACLLSKQRVAALRGSRSFVCVVLSAPIIGAAAQRVAEEQPFLSFFLSVSRSVAKLSLLMSEPKLLV